jgi:osmoprotectant transport system substrate-binding protein
VRGSRVIRAAGAVGAALVLGVGVAACGGSDKTSTGGQPGSGKPPVTIGAKNFTEEFILGQLYTQALRAKGFKASLKNNIGSSEVTYKALTSGKIDAYPEYTGELVSTIGHQNTKPKSEDEAYDIAKKFVEGQGFALTQKTPFFDRDTVAVKNDFAQKNGLKQIGDLKKLGSKVIYGSPPDARTRFQGLVGLRQVYGLTKLQFKPLAIGLQYQALDQDKINAADVFTTDGQLAGGKYTLLDDPQNIFGFQNVAMVIHKNVAAKEGPEFTKTIDAVSAKLTTEAIQKMNAAVVLDKNPPADVARKFLEANGLL